MDKLRNDVEALRREMRELRQRVEELKTALHGRTLGTKRKPIELIYTLDKNTGAVAEVDFDSVSDAVRAVRRS